MRTITITLPDEIAGALEAEAQASGRDLAELAGEQFATAWNAVHSLQGKRPADAPYTNWSSGEPVYARPEAPAWLTGIPPHNPASDGTNGLHRVVGKWPGTETDEEIADALERLS